ncbi:MAG: hypothetical protein H0U70_06225 [Tatlockia sp.]|nr:hypothetical protein [Tatlockia sp.]
MKLKQELTNLILDNEKLTAFLDKTVKIMDVFNQSNDPTLIKQELTKPEHYSLLKQMASISDYLSEISNCVVMQFVDYALKKNSDKSSGAKIEIPVDLQKFIALHLMHSLEQNNIELYKLLSQPITNESNASFEVLFDSPIPSERTEVTYQFLFDSKAKTWKLLRFLPHLAEGEVINKKGEEDEYKYLITHKMKLLLTDLTPETLNPFIKKALLVSLQSCEDYQQTLQQKALLKQIFKEQCNNFFPLIEKYCHDIPQSLPLYMQIDNIHQTYFHNIENKPELMAELLLEEGIFELKNDFRLIVFLAKKVNWIQLEKLLDKESIKNSLLNADFFDLHFFAETSAQGLDKMSGFYFEQASPKQLKNMEGYIKSQWASALPIENFIKFINEGKIKLDYPEYAHSIEEFYKLFPSAFPAILNDLISSGKMIRDIPRDKNIVAHYVDLFFKYEGQWLSLITYDKENVYNHKADLLNLAMKIDPKRTVAIVTQLARINAQGEKYLPFSLNAEEISNLITTAPDDACVLLDYKNILDRLRQDSVLFKPYGKIRKFDQIYKLMHGIPPLYGQKLMENGLVFPEKGMPHFQHLSGLGLFGGNTPSSSIAPIFKMLYQNLTSSEFMASLINGLIANQNVHRLFFKDVFNMDLLKLAEALRQITSIRNLELAIDLNKDNQTNIIQFFNLMSESHPDLKFHIQVKLSMKNDEFIFLKNYLAKTTVQIKTLIIIPEHHGIKFALLDVDDLNFKNFFDGCIKEICQENSILSNIMINGFGKPLFSFRNESSPSYRFTQFPIYNTHLFAINSSENFATEEDDLTAKLLARNKNIYALNLIAQELRQCQSILELLPWLTMQGLSPELIVNIFDRLNLDYSLPAKNSSYATLLKWIKKSQSTEHENDDDLSMQQYVKGLKQLENFVQSTSVQAYYCYKPYKENIDKLKIFLSLSKLQTRVIKVLTDWFIDNRRPNLMKMLASLAKVNKIIDGNDPANSNLLNKRGKLSYILELNGIPSENANKASVKFCNVSNQLNIYQKAVSHSLKQLQREAFIALQTDSPLGNSFAWNALVNQAFNGFELLSVLDNFRSREDLNQTLDSSFKKSSSSMSAIFDNRQTILLINIVHTLGQYLKQKEKPLERQCDRHKHLHKNELFNLISLKNIEIYKETKPRLYQILLSQRERLATSISKCSIKLILRHNGFFSNHYQEKKIVDEKLISNYEQQITQRVSQLQ